MGQPHALRPRNITSIWKIDDLKATLRCDAHVRMSVHRGTAANSTTPGFFWQYQAGPWAQELLLAELAYLRLQQETKLTILRCISNVGIMKGL